MHGFESAGVYIKIATLGHVEDKHTKPMRVRKRYPANFMLTTRSEEQSS